MNAPLLTEKELFFFINCFQCGIKVSALVLSQRDTFTATLVVRVPLSYIQLGGISVPRNKVCFLGVPSVVLSEDGKEITLYRLVPGDICMLSASCVLNSITFDVYVDAEVPSDCYRISSAAFGDVSSRYLEVKNYALETAVGRFSDVMWIMQQVVFMSMDKRLAIFLLEETQASGTDTVTLTHEMIARHLGTAREVVTRMLKHIASDGLIEVTRKGIVIKDKKKLQNLAY